MAAESQLTRNVYVDGTWYGPSHPGNEVTNEVREAITNPGAWQGTVDDRMVVEEAPAPAPRAPTPAMDDSPGPVGYPVDGTVDEVRAWVGDDPARARVALDAEEARNTPRTTLVDALRSIASD